MKEVILLLTVLVMFIVCFFVMGKIGYFINENYKAFIIGERESTQSCKLDVYKRQLLYYIVRSYSIKRISKSTIFFKKIS